MPFTPDPDHPPRTRASLAHDLTTLGLSPADTLLVHSSLRSLGWVCGGAPAVIQALTDAIGAEGTLAVPTHTGDNSDPAQWSAPAVPASWWPTIREHSPAYDPQVTPTRGMGRIPETLRTWPGAVRSAHPQTSFAALGPRAHTLTRDHPLHCALGERSPLARLEQAHARVLLLGVDYASCTAFHLAEYRLPRPAEGPSSCAVLRPDRTRAWVTYTDVILNSADFDDLGAAFEATGAVTTGPVGQARARLFSLPRAVAFARSWMSEHRTG